MTSGTGKRRLRQWQDHVRMMLIGVGIAFLIQLGIGRLSPSAMGIGVGVLAAGLGLWACLKGPRVDEMSLAGAKFAWLWGGFAGLALGLGLAVWSVLAGGGLGWPVTPGELRSFGLGVILIIGTQMLAYLAILAGWWWRKGGL